MKCKLAILCFCLWFSCALVAQESLLKGKLFDAQTLEPLVFATVRVKGKSLGVVSNSDGSFRIPERFKFYGDTLQISSMGYDKRELLISTLSADRVREIFVQPGVFELQEAVVKAKRKRSLSARKIVRRAIDNIPQNYPFQQFSTVGYYRDYQLRENEYVNLNEAILEVFDQGFGQLDTATTDVRIYDYKQNTDFERDTLADNPYNYKSMRKIIDNAYLFNYGGNEFTLLRVHDAIRNFKVNSFSFVNRLDLHMIDNHNFKKDGNTYLDGEVLYTIRFRKTYPNYSAFGTLYISRVDFAIHKMEYAVYDDRKRNPDCLLNKHNSSGRLIFDVATEYQRRNDNKMYLNYISFHNSFILWEPPKFKVDHINASLNRRCFIVEFNREPEKKEALNHMNYVIKYKGKRLKLRSAQLLENKVFLFTAMDMEEEITMLDEILDATGDEAAMAELLTVKIRGIKDTEGNMLHEWTKKNYNQFREFFTQQVRAKAAVPQDGLFMNKGKPIYKDQPIDRPDNFGDYWMNTPLQKIAQ